MSRSRAKAPPSIGCRNVIAKPVVAGFSPRRPISRSRAEPEPVSKLIPRDGHSVEQVPPDYLTVDSDKRYCVPDNGFGPHDGFTPHDDFTPHDHLIPCDRVVVDAIAAAAPCIFRNLAVEFRTLAKG